MEHTRQDREIKAGDAGGGRAVTLHDEMIRAEVDQSSKQGTGRAEGIVRINSSLVNAHIFTYFFRGANVFQEKRDDLSTKSPGLAGRFCHTFPSIPRYGRI